MVSSNETKNRANVVVTRPSERESCYDENGKRMRWYSFIGSMHIVCIESIYLAFSLVRVCIHNWHTTTRTKVTTTAAAAAAKL